MAPGSPLSSLLPLAPPHLHDARVPSKRSTKRKRRRRSEPSSVPVETSPGAEREEKGAREPAPEAREAASTRSSAALVALLACLWGQSLLFFDWARRTIFEEAGSGHLVLVVPVFLGATLAAALAVHARLRGSRPVGGGVVHSLGLASGLLGLTAVVLLLWLGPRLEQGSAASRRDAVSQQLETVGRALELHLDEQGTYPVGFGVETLAAALAPEYLTEAFPMRDPWGAPLHYQSLAGGGGYLLLSTGPDRVQDLSDDEYLTESTSRRTTNDTVMISGRFVAGASPADPR